MMSSNKNSNLEKKVGCIYATTLDDVPTFLLESGPIEVNPDSSITMYSSSTMIKTGFPILILYEYNTSAPGNYYAWVSLD